MRIPNIDRFPLDPIFHAQQGYLFWGTDDPDTTATFTMKTVGSVYIRQVAVGHVQRFVKVKNDLAGNDWVLEWGCLSYTVLKSDFTDGGSTSGTYNLPSQLPAGAKVKTITVRHVVAFSGDTSATLIVGVTGTDTDQFNTGTPSVFTSANFIDMGPPSGDAELEAATTVTLLITSATDFTNVVATGKLTINIPYTF